MEFLEIPLYDDDIFKLLVRFVWNIAVLTCCVVLAIYPGEKKREFVFTAVMMNIMVFFICFTLKKFELELGMALGLFAIFGVLRYRTTTLQTKEMTYLFVVIGIAVINSLSNKKTSYAELLVVNFTIVLSAVLMERFYVGCRLSQHNMNYDKVELLRPENRALLLQDIKERTGFDVTRVDIQSVSLRKQSAILLITYDDPNRNQRTVSTSSTSNSNPAANTGNESDSAT